MTAHARGVTARRRGRLALGAVLVLMTLALGLRFAVHRVAWLGPALADGLRAAVGARAVTRLEEKSADLEDRWNRVVKRRRPPRPIDEVAPLPAASAAPRSEAQLAMSARPKDVGPMDARVAAPGDGSWTSVPDPARPNDAPVLFATLLHPDPKRSWAEVFIVAADVSQIRLHAVAGTLEPEATTSEGRKYVRSGRIAAEHEKTLLAAFNGGFKTQHGHHGMHVDGVTLLPAQDRLCTFVGYEDGELALGTWKAIASELQGAASERRIAFWRQAAPCMYERGTLNSLLRDEETRNWGATIEGNVVIRRSAVGLNATGRFLYFGVSNATTARAMATAMNHAGASDVAQLDVNWSYPKFLLFPLTTDGRRRAESLFKGFMFREGEYIERPSSRDFFYMVRRD